MFNKVTGRVSLQNPNGEAKTLFNAKAINTEQFKLVGEIIAMYEGVTVLTRKQLRDAHTALRNKKAAPYFISKNVACKTRERGMYDLTRLKLSAAAAKAPVDADEEVPPAVKGKKESKRTKREVTTAVTKAPKKQKALAAAPAIDTAEAA